MAVTMPEPTVLPPSRIAKRSPWSIAIGEIRSAVIVTLSPGITISTPARRATPPLTSVVRKQNLGRYPLQNGGLRPPPPLPPTPPPALTFPCAVRVLGFARPLSPSP